MLKILRLNNSFARMRARKQMKFDKKLTDFTQTQESRMKISHLRKQYQQQGLTNTLSSVLNEPKQKIKQKLGQRFSVDYSKLQKEMKHTLIKNAKIEKLQQLQEGDLKLLHESDSYIYDQQLQIQFEKQFKKRLFYKKEVARLIQIKQFEPHNHIAGKQDQQYIEYLKNKDKLKNGKIQNMMGFNRNNQQLELLIQSGLIDDPDSFRNVIQKIQTSKLTKSPGQNLLPQNTISSQPILTVAQGQGNQIQQSQTRGQQDRVQKIAKILECYKEMNQADRQKYHQQINTLYDIKKYENQVFNQRYEAINFRFKGQTGFDHMKDTEFFSYIKHTNIQPTDLLLIFKQNQSKINRFNYPIITPLALSSIYTKSSFYVFPETQHNNRLNMLSDPIFRALEKKTFQSLKSIDNSSFADTVWAYSKNHEAQQGLLKPAVSLKIQDVIYQEIAERVASLTEEDLGLSLRAIMKLPFIGDENRDWGPTVQVIKDRLPSMKESYEIESVMNFISLIPPTPSTIKVIRKNIHLLMKHTWQFHQSLTTFLRLSSFLLNHHTQRPLQMIKSKLASIIQYKYDQKQLQRLIPKYSINSIAYFNAVLLKSEVQIPELVNMSKRYAIESIKAQKQLLRRETLPMLTLSFAQLDFWQAFRQHPSSLKVMVPGRVLIYNSAKYFAYHEIAKLTSSELKYLGNKGLSDILLGCSLVQYKNQGFYDNVVESILRKFDIEKNSISKPQLLKVYINLIHCFALQRRVNNLYDEIRDEIFSIIEQFKGRDMKAIRPNQFLQLVVNITSLDGRKLNSSHIHTLNEIVEKIVHPYVKLFSRQDLIGLFFAIFIYLRKGDVRDEIKQQLRSHSDKLTIQELFTIYLSTSKEEYEQINSGQHSSKYRLDNIQRLYYEQRLDSMLAHEQHVGTQYSFIQVYEKFRRKIEQKYPTCQIIQRPWMLQVPDIKKAFLFVTYDHLMSRQQMEPDTKKAGKTILSLFGVWKAYPIILQDRGWTIDVVYTFLQTRDSLQTEAARSSLTT